MSESAARQMRDQRPAIDLEEFERRLRAPEPTRRSEDPLAELARLVGSANDPFKDMFAAQQNVAALAAPAQGQYQPPAVQSPQAYQPEQAYHEIPAQDLNPETAPHALRAVAGQMRHAAGEYDPAQAQGHMQPVQPAYTSTAPHQANQEQWSGYEQEQTEAAAPRPAPAQQWEEEAEAPTRLRGVRTPLPPENLDPATRERATMSRKSILYMGSALAVVIVGIGATLATSGKMKPGSVPTVTASKEPIKVKPEGEEAPRQVRTVSILDKSGTNKPQQSNAVSREEQPVDLSQVPAAPRGGGRVPEGDLNRMVNLNSNDVNKPVASVAPQGQKPPQAGGYFPEPRKVRTVSVRPDGSVVADAPAPAAARAPSVASLAAGTPAPRPSVALPAAPAPAPRAAAPAPRAPAASAAPAEKTTARANRPPNASEIARNGGEQPDTAPTASTPRPASRPAPVAERPKPAAATQQRVASATPAAAPSGNGGFAVQLAAPPSEAEAQSTASRLRQRFASELGGRSPSVRAASVGDKTVYRVRIGGLSREDATALCSKLQGKGGACFVAKN